MVVLVGDESLKNFTRFCPAFVASRTSLPFRSTALPGEGAGPRIRRRRRIPARFDGRSATAASLKLFSVRDFVDEDTVGFLAGTGVFATLTSLIVLGAPPRTVKHGRADDHVLGFLKLVLAIGLRPAEDARLNGDAFLVISFKSENRTSWLPRGGQP